MKAAKASVRKLALVAFGIFLGLAIAEIALRIYSPVEFELRGDRIELRKSKTWVVRGNNPKLDELINHTHNSIGFQGEDPPPNVDQFLSVITVGGSTTHQLFIDDSKTWTALLGRKLSRNFRDIWVNNAGLDGHSTFGHLILLQEHLAPLRPKVVLFLIGVNDVGRDTAIPQEVVPERFLDPLEDLAKALASRSEVAALPLNIYRTWRSPAEFSHDPGLDVTTVGSTIIPESQKREVIAQIEAKFVEAYQERLLNLIHVAKALEIKPVLITQPALYGNVVDEATGVDLATANVGNINGGLEWDRLEVYNEQTRQLGQSEGVPVIDLAAKMPHNSEYYIDWIHFSNTGSQLVEDIIFRNLCAYLAIEFPEYYVNDCA